MSETKHPILSLNGHMLVDQEARDAAAQSAAAAAANATRISELSEEIEELTAPLDTTAGRIVQFTTDEGSAVIVESGAEVLHAGRNLFEVGESDADYIKASYFVGVDQDTQTIRLKVGSGSAAHVIRSIKIPFSKGMSIHIATECVDNEVNVAVPMLRVESADGTIITSGCTGTYIAYYTGFIPSNHDAVPASCTFTCNDDSAAYCRIGMIVKSDKGVDTGAETTIRVMAEIENPTGIWEAGFLRSYTSANNLVEIQTVPGANNFYANDQSEITVISSTSPLVRSVNGKRGVVALSAKDVGAVSTSKQVEVTYNTVAEMLKDEDLPVGKCARTLGYYSVGDGGAASYTVDATDNGYGIVGVNGYCNIVAEAHMSPKMFGAVANGDYVNTDDSNAFQSCLDFCAGRSIVDITDGCYVIHDVKLYNNKTYDIVGGNRERIAFLNYLPSSIVVKHGYETAFVGSTESGDNDAAGLPVLRLNMRGIRASGYYTAEMGYPTFIKDVHLVDSRIEGVYTNCLGCFFEGIMSGFCSVSDCVIVVSDCAFRSHYVVDDIFHKGFVDCAFYSNFFMGITKFGNGHLFKPVVFEAYGFYTTQFSSNFIGGMWAIVGCKKLGTALNAEFLGWWSRDNVYSMVVEFATIRDDSIGITAGDVKFFGDQMWNCSRTSLVNTAEGHAAFSDIDGNTRIEGDRTIFFNFARINTGTFRDIVVRFCDPLFPDEMQIEKVTINRPVFLFERDGGDFSESAHVFDTKIPLEKFVENRDTSYKYTRIEPWNDRVVDALPVIQDENYRHVLEGQTCYYNNKLLTCRGDNWYDAMGNVVAE